MKTYITLAGTPVRYDCSEFALYAEGTRLTASELIREFISAVEAAERDGKEVPAAGRWLDQNIGRFERPAE